jgi:hypothetical protein
MAKAAKIVLPRRWQRFPSAYAKNLDYWYFPKGLAATAASIRPRLQALKPLNGMPWRDAQVDYIKTLNKAEVTDAETEWEGGGAPLARMLVQVMRTIGLAWVNPAERVEITDAGEQFLSGGDPDQVLSTQLDRYQFWNPTIHATVHQIVKVHPIPFLAEVLRTINPQSISAHEYELFVARARSYDDVDDVVELIDSFRALDEQERDALCDHCAQYMIGGKGRTSLFRTISLNRSYAFSALTLSKLVEREGSGLKLRHGALRAYRPYLQRYQANHTFIDFDSVEDWIAYFGDPSAEPTIQTALEYYVGKGYVESALAVKKKQGTSKAELKEFKEMIVSEKAIEDYLENNLDYIGKPCKYDLILVGPVQHDRRSD